MQILSSRNNGMAHMIEVVFSYNRNDFINLTIAYSGLLK